MYVQYVPHTYTYNHKGQMTKLRNPLFKIAKFRANEPMDFLSPLF